MFVRAERGEPHRDDILALHASCKGNLVRVHEELIARGIVTLYPALTAFCRKHGIGHEPPKPKGQYHFKPGQEMQHDTSPHDVHIGGALRRVQTASLVPCFSRRLFFQFYPRFTRFECKVFLDDAATITTARASTAWSITATSSCCAAPARRWCRIRRWRRSLAGSISRSSRMRKATPIARCVLRGRSGSSSGILAGRKFTDFTDANRQAREWCDKVNAKFRRSLSASSNELFVVGRAAMRRLPLSRTCGHASAKNGSATPHTPRSPTRFAPSSTTNSEVDHCAGNSLSDPRCSTGSVLASRPGSVLASVAAQCHTAVRCC